MGFVIDADIARASGTSEHPVSSSSRLLLDAIKKNGAMICFCDELQKEWNVHKSRYAKTWLVSMYSKKKVQIKKISGYTKSHLEKLNESIEQKAAIKDAHLIDLAFLSQKIVFSNDGKAREAFSQLLCKRDEFNIYWMSAKDHINDIVLYPLKGKRIPQKYHLFYIDPNTVTVEN
ncbi:hypothetical protein [Gilliamella sp. wkB112]|uniref:hypothetical protein n=1 Tax=Gilliamella sp. wkB112 TaxID=3120257 RepID=UPI00080E5912|nr:hypothetical protein [Gilliamella apicola]OCG00335.1 hypothetical protein A9G12_04405 [Gilliamella apicola]